MDKPIYQNVPLQPTTSKQVIKSNTQKNAEIKTPFLRHFNQALSHGTNNLTISKHALDRLNQRGIKIDSSLWNKIGTKVTEAKQKGVDQSLVLVNNAALIVSAKNKTVITAMDRTEATSQIFTNINGAIIVD